MKGQKKTTQTGQQQKQASQFFMSREERLMFNLMTDKRRLVEEKRSAINAELELAQMLQEQLKFALQKRLSIPDGTVFTMNHDGSIIIHDDGALASPADEKKSETKEGDTP